MKDKLKTIWITLRVFIPLMILLVVFGAILYVFNKIGNSESFNIVLGITLGVFAGFFADSVKKDWDYNQKNKIFKNTVFRLLEQDAKSIFRMFEMWGGMRETSGKPGSPPNIDKILPPDLEMRYWKKLSLKNDFLMLAADKSFDDVFKKFWDFEKIDRLIDGSKNEMDENKRKQSYMFAMAFSIKVLEDLSHEEILKLFLNDKELKEYKENWRKQ